MQLTNLLTGGCLRMEITARKPPQSASPYSVALERHYSVSEVATLWSLSERTVRRLFEEESGVLMWGHSENHRRRCYKTLRIPESVLVRVHQRRQIAS
jgi:AraC-like DNA-binding protein